MRAFVLCSFVLGACVHPARLPASSGVDRVMLTEDGLSVLTASRMDQASLAFVFPEDRVMTLEAFHHRPEGDGGELVVVRDSHDMLWVSVIEDQGADSLVVVSPDIPSEHGLRVGSRFHELEATGRRLHCQPDPACCKLGDEGSHITYNLDLVSAPQGDEDLTAALHRVNPQVISIAWSLE